MRTDGGDAPVRRRGHEAEPRVVGGVALEQQQRRPLAIGLLDRRRHQGPSVAAALVGGVDRQRAEHQDLDQPRGGVHPGAGQADVTDDPSLVDGDQGRAEARVDGQGPHEVGDVVAGADPEGAGGQRGDGVELGIGLAPDPHGDIQSWALASASWTSFRSRRKAASTCSRAAPGRRPSTSSTSGSPSPSWRRSSRIVRCRRSSAASACAVAPTRGPPAPGRFSPEADEVGAGPPAPGPGAGGARGRRGCVPTGAPPRPGRPRASSSARGPSAVSRKAARTSAAYRAATYSPSTTHAHPRARRHPTATAAAPARDRRQPRRQSGVELPPGVDAVAERTTQQVGRDLRVGPGAAGDSLDVEGARDLAARRVQHGQPWPLLLPGLQEDPGVVEPADHPLRLPARGDLPRRHLAPLVRLVTDHEPSPGRRPRHEPAAGRVDHRSRRQPSVDRDPSHVPGGAHHVHRAVRRGPGDQAVGAEADLVEVVAAELEDLTSVHGQRADGARLRERRQQVARVACPVQGRTPHHPGDVDGRSRGPRRAGVPEREAEGALRPTLVR